MVKKIVLSLLVVLALSGVSYGRGRNRHPVLNTGKAAIHVVKQTAQESAHLMAKLGYIAHFGGHHPHYEGIACATTPEQAYNSCCYANSGFTTVDSAVVQGANGMWYACRRYER